VFHFYLSSQGWRIYDVTSNGASAVDGLRRAYFAERFERQSIRPVAAVTR
jgi:hypothetical protein